MDKRYSVRDKTGKWIYTLGGDEWCYAAKGKLPINESCGGCTGCLIAQCEHWGFSVSEIDPVEEKKKLDASKILRDIADRIDNCKSLEQFNFEAYPNTIDIGTGTLLKGPAKMVESLVYKLRIRIK